MEKFKDLESVINELIMLTDTFQALDLALSNGHSTIPPFALTFPVDAFKSCVGKAQALYEEAADELGAFNRNEVA